jgi:hypothetical protein
MRDPTEIDKESPLEMANYRKTILTKYLHVGWDILTYSFSVLRYLQGIGISKLKSVQRIFTQVSLGPI